MVLLPSSAYDELDEQSFTTGNMDPDLQRLYTLISHHLKITHIASTRPIPPQDDDQGKENIIRAPKNFTPLYGDFGPATCVDPPTQADFDAAYWVTAKQNGIYQTWAPRWTMFSRGNVSEKARLLTLPTVLSAVDEGVRNGRGCCAVDLYAGIGYFTFSYLRAGVGKVLCWDINPWSCEGLMRGAAANKWTGKRAVDGKAAEGNWVGETRVMVFNESNVKASQWVREMRDSLPPVRHVNCGLLPTSRDSRQTAVEVLDPSAGGWLHVHENFAVSEITQKAEEVRQQVQHLVDQRTQHASRAQPRHVEVEQINRLKSYAPGVMHCVIDVYIPPSVPL